MRKSSSAQLFPLDFNPKDFKVGASKIETLPIRRNSTSNIHTLPSQSTRNDLDLLKRQNAALQRQNQQLKRELQKMKLQSTNGTILKTGEKTSNYKEMIRGKLSSKTKQSRNTQCQTRLLSSKQFSMEGSTLTISDYYDQYRLSHKIPALSDLMEIADRFFKDYCDGYAKLKCLFDCLQCSKHAESYKKLEGQIQLYRVPLLYQKSPQTLLRQISKSKERIKTKGREQSSAKNRRQKEEVCPEQMSPSETALRIQTLLGKVCRSGQILRMLRGNQTVLRFVLKIQERL